MGRTFTKAPSGQRQEVRFVRWSDIISLRIHGRIVGGGNHAQMQDFLDVKTRQNETLSCLLHAPDIFVEAVKAAGHGGLLDAKSKYLKGWDAEYADEFDDEKIDIDAKGFLHFWAYCGGSILAAVLIMHVAIAPFTHRALIIWLAIAFVPGILALVWFLAKKNARSKK
jgi:hypothetical protein